MKQSVCLVIYGLVYGSIMHITYIKMPPLKCYENKVLKQRIEKNLRRTMSKLFKKDFFHGRDIFLKLIEETETREIDLYQRKMKKIVRQQTTVSIVQQA